MYTAFKTWITATTQLRKKSINNYCGGLNKITRDLIEENLIQNSLDEIEQVEQVEQIKAEYFAIAKYKEQDTRGRNMYNAAFNKYIYFRKETAQKESWFDDKIEVLSDNPETAETLKNMLKKGFLNS